MSGRQKCAVLLLAHGSPNSPDQVPEFLLRVTGGRTLPPEAIEEVKRRYQAIGRSPLPEITRHQGERLAGRLGVPVYIAMRNWHPLVSETLNQMVADGVRQAVVICLAPHNSRTSVGLYRQSLRSAETPDLAFVFVESRHDQPRLIQAFAERLRAGREKAQADMGSGLPVVFTAHSVPQRTIAEGDPYERQARETAALVASTAALQPDSWRFAFQSQGMAGGAWLGPTVEETILEFKRRGQGAVFVQPVGFLCDHVEILYDIDISYKRFAEQQGMQLFRAESLNESPFLIAALEEIANARLCSRVMSAE
jgi:ferrochelatase